MLRVLHVEDSEADAILIRRELARTFDALRVERVQSADAFRSALEAADWDLVLADHRMPGFDALAALEILQATGRDIPFIIVSGSIGEAVAVSAMRAGARDYVSKDGLPRLGVAAERELREARGRRARALAEEKARQAQERLAVMLESTHDRVFTFDRDLRIDAVFGAWLREEGLAPETYLGRRPTEFHGPAGDVHEAAYRRALAGERVVFEWTEGAGPQVRCFQTSVSPLRASDGTVIGGAGIARDITRLKEVESQLVMSERLVAVGTLAASVAHEVNNPLACIVASLHLLGEELPSVADPALRARLGEPLEDAALAARRVQETVADLRILARDDDRPAGPVDVASVLEASVRLAWNQVRHRARLVRELAPTPPVLGSESRLGQVFLNLIVNAAQAIPDGAEGHRITLRSGVDGGDVWVEVEDSGVGMSQEVLARLFTPFFTTKPAGVGTGLGLSISRGIVKALGGRLEARSRLGEGSVFRVCLPAAPSTAAPPAPRPSPAGPQAGRRARLLVVDDEPFLCRAISRTLARDHDVEVAASGAEALARIRTSPPVEFVLCDLMMPTMTGMELLERLRLEAPALAGRFLFLSGGAFTPEAQAYLRQSATPCILKPFEPDELRRVVNAALRGTP